MTAALVIAAIVVSYTPYECNACSHACGGDRLIHTFAANRALKYVAFNRLAGLRQTPSTNQIIRIRPSDNDNVPMRQVGHDFTSFTLSRSFLRTAPINSPVDLVTKANVRWECSNIPTPQQLGRSVAG